MDMQTPKTDSKDRWMDIAEAAEYLHISKDYLYRLAQKGEVPAFKLGSIWRFKREAIDEWAESKSNQSKKRIRSEKA